MPPFGNIRHIVTVVIVVTVVDRVRVLGFAHVVGAIAVRMFRWDDI